VSFDIYSAGVKRNINSARSVIIDNTVGIHYIYFDSAGVLQKSTSPWDITSANVPVAIIFWNGSTGRIWDERHGANRNQAWHKWAHDTIGMRYETGLAGTFTDDTFSIAAGEVHDEDLASLISPAKTSCLIVYKTAGGGNMTFDSAPVTTPYRQSGGVIQRDDGDGTPGNVSNTNFGNYWIYATNDIGTPIYCILGDGNYNTIALARAAGLPLIPISTAEWKLLYKVIYQQTAGGIVYRESVDYRLGTTLPAISNVTPANPIAANISVDTTNFDGLLSSADTTVQAALETIDDCLALGGIIAHHKDNTITLYKPAENTDNARGTALLAAIAAAVAGDVIEIGCGQFTISANVINMAVTGGSFSIKGQGERKSIIRSSGNRILVAASDCEVSDVYLYAQTIENNGIGIDTPASAITDFKVHDCRIKGMIAGVVLNSPTTQTTVEIRDTIITSGTTGIDISGNVSARLLNLAITIVADANLPDGGAHTYGIICTGSSSIILKSDDVDISATGGSVNNYGYYIANEANVTIDGGEVVTGSTGPLDIYTTNATTLVKYTNSVIFDNDKVTGLLQLVPDHSVNRIVPLGNEVFIRADNYDMETAGRDVRYFKFCPAGDGAFSWTCYLPDAGKINVNGRGREICLINASVANGFSQLDLTVYKSADNPGGRILSAGAGSLLSFFSLPVQACCYLYSTLIPRNSAGTYNKWVWAMTLASAPPPPT
jgi:hypothetical protein